MFYKLSEERPDSFLGNKRFVRKCARSMGHQLLGVNGNAIASCARSDQLSFIANVCQWMCPAGAELVPMHIHVALARCGEH